MGSNVTFLRFSFGVRVGVIKREVCIRHIKGNPRDDEAGLIKSHGNSGMCIMINCSSTSK